MLIVHFLDWLSSESPENFSGTGSIEIFTSDLANTGSGGTRTDTDLVSINVNAVNDAPVLSPIGNRIVCQSSLLTFNAIASDIDIPVQSLSFTLVNAPAGASITPSGLFTWTPTITQSGNYTFTVRVTDNGTPALSDSEDITVTVNPLPGSISGTTTIYVGSTAALSSSTTGGTWSSSNTAVAVVNPSSGVVTGVSLGAATIRYTLGTGCFVTATVSVQQYEYNTSFPVGWSWFSVNATSANMSLGNILSACAANGDYIKDQVTSATYYAGFGWFGTLSAINPARLYKLRVANSCGIQFMGNPVNVTSNSINLVAGWNWIGYFPLTSISINTALSSISPANLDYIKNQTSSATFYSGFGWFGTLSSLRPEDGYMIRVTNPGTIIYPEVGLKSGNSVGSADYAGLDPTRFEFNGSVTAGIIKDGNQIGNEDDLLFAYAGDQIRGIVGGHWFEPSNSWVYPIMIHSNLEEGEVISFKYLNSSDNSLKDCNETLVFRKDMVVADALKSLQLTLSESSAETDIDIENPFSLTVYPNPFMYELNFTYLTRKQGHVRLNVYDIHGRLVKLLVNEVQESGKKNITWNPEGLSEGIYIIHLVIDGNHTVRKVTFTK